MIRYLSEQADDAPFFAYGFHGAARSAAGAERLARSIHGRLRAGLRGRTSGASGPDEADGLAGVGLEDNPGSGLFPSWDELESGERLEQARKMDIYAAMDENLDHNIGRVLDRLKAQDKYENSHPVHVG